jgi:hypothetical protein
VRVIVLNTPPGEEAEEVVEEGEEEKEMEKMQIRSSACYQYPPCQVTVSSPIGSTSERTASRACHTSTLRCTP